jgi:hypothetical protein
MPLNRCIDPSRSWFIEKACFRYRLEGFDGQRFELGSGRLDRANAYRTGVLFLLVRKARDHIRWSFTNP